MANTLSTIEKESLKSIKTGRSQDEIFSSIASRIRKSYDGEMDEKDISEVAKNVINLCEKIIDMKINQEHEEKNDLVDRKTAAKFLGVKENTLAVWATNNRYNVPYIKVGRLVKYRIRDLEIFLEQNLKSF